MEAVSKIYLKLRYYLGCILLNTAELPNILLNTNIYFTLCKCKRNKATKAPV